MSIFDQLIDITGIDFSTGQRGVQPMKEVIEKSKVRKIKDLSQPADVYGGLDKLPSNLKPASVIRVLFLLLNQLQEFSLSLI